MIKIKSSKTKKLLGFGDIMNSIGGVTSSLGTDKFDLSNPMDSLSCPTGNCGDLAGSVNKFAKSKILGSSVGDLWKQLVCGEFEERDSGSSFESQQKSTLWLRSTNCSAVQLLNLLKIDNGKVKIDTETIKGRLKKISKNMISDTKQAALVGSISNLTGKNNEESAIILNGVKTIIENKDVRDVDDFVNLMGSFTGNEALLEVLDLQAEAAVLGDLLKQASDLGILDAVDIILEKVRDDKMRRAILLDNLMNYVMWSDLDMVNKTIEHVGNEKIMAKYPNIVNSILQYYKFKTTSDSTKLEGYKDELLNTINTLDDEWAVADRNRVATSDLSPFANASKSSIKVLKLDPLYEVEAHIAEKHVGSSMIRVAKYNVNNIHIY